MRADPPTGRSVLRGAVSGQRRLLTASCLLAGSHQAGEALVPVLIGVIIDDAVSPGSLPALLVWLGALAVVFVGLSLSFRFADRTAERSSEQAAHDLRLRVTGRVLDPHGGAEGSRLPGELVSVATGDAKRVGAAVGALPFAFAGLAALLVSAVVLLSISVPLGLVILLGIPPVLWLTHLVGKPLERRSDGEQDRAARASGVAADLVAGIRVLKGLGAERAAVARYHRTSQDSRAAAIRATRAHGWHDGAVLAVTGIFLAAVALLGALLALRGQISIGELVAAVGLAQFLLTPFQMITWANGEYAQARASAARVAEVLAAPPSVESGAGRPADPIAGTVELTGVSYGALQQLDLTLPAGGLVGVVSTSPAAAVDLLAVLGRTAAPDAGEVTLDGVAVSGLDVAALRRAVLVAEHDADLFEDTLADAVGAPAHPAVRAATVDEVAEALPDGMDTLLAERGSSLSGGQRQRVALARALAADPPVLVLHDPTTAVDPVTEAAIAQGIAELRAGRTTILVTTSPALLAVADTVFLLDGGQVTARGTHAELAAAHADYRSAVFG